MRKSAIVRLYLGSTIYDLALRLSSVLQHRLTHHPGYGDVRSRDEDKDERLKTAYPGRINLETRAGTRRLSDARPVQPNERCPNRRRSDCTPGQPIPSVPKEQTRIERQTGLSGIHRDAAGIETSDQPLVVARRPSPIPQRQSGLPMRLFANHLKIAKTL